MADPNKFKSVSVPIDTYRKLEFLANGKFLDAKLTISKTIEALATELQRRQDIKMEKQTHNIICQDCKGNGYRRILIEEGREEVITDCETCDNQGEFKVGDEKLHS